MSSSLIEFKSSDPEWRRPFRPRPNTHLVLIFPRRPTTATIMHSAPHDCWIIYASKMIFGKEHFSEHVDIKYGWPAGNNKSSQPSSMNIISDRYSLLAIDCWAQQSDDRFIRPVHHWSQQRSTMSPLTFIQPRWSIEKASSSSVGHREEPKIRALGGASARLMTFTQRGSARERVPMSPIPIYLSKRFLAWSDRASSYVSRSGLRRSFVLSRGEESSS